MKTNSLKEGEKLTPDDIIIRDCNKCSYLNITEEQQTNNKQNHICTLSNNKVYHRGMHPILPAYLNDCPKLLRFEKELSENQVNKYKHYIEIGEINE